MGRVSGQECVDGMGQWVRMRNRMGQWAGMRRWHESVVGKGRKRHESVNKDNGRSQAHMLPGNEAHLDRACLPCGKGP
eukprot:1137433-Pelagomonas_calceolata.AAC.8